MTAASAIAPAASGNLLQSWLHEGMADGTLGPLLLLAVLGLWMLGAHNRVTALRGAVLAAWGPVEAAMAQRAHAVTMLLAHAAEPLAGERAAMEAVAAAQAQLGERIDTVKRRPAQRDAVAELSKADAVLAATLPRLLALIEQQPALMADGEVQQALATLAEARPRLAFARQAFNHAGTVYNAAVEQFPTRLLGSLFRFGEAGQL